jgi:Ca-activated chloride channel family protein
MKIPRILVFGILLTGSAQASSWSDLWYRRDQQGQQALQAGDTKRAAELFADPRRQAYAELQSQQYGAAAKRLEPFADAASQYNRGNALARSGELQAALNAYDGALEHADLESSLRRDAQHNRDLVARHLQAQEDQQHSSGRQPPPNDQQNGKPQGDESKDGWGASGSSSPPATAGSASPSQGEQHEPGGGGSRGSPPSRSSPPSSPARGEAGDEQRQANGNPQSAAERNAAAPQASQRQAAGQQAAGQQAAEQQAAGQADVGRKQQSLGAPSRSGTEQVDSGRAPDGDSVPPQTEQQLALEQWLRQIPDDPGGLLRRKFMIEHWMKQQQVQP